MSEDLKQLIKEFNDIKWSDKKPTIGSAIASKILQHNKMSAISDRDIA